MHTRETQSTLKRENEKYSLAKMREQDSIQVICRLLLHFLKILVDVLHRQDLQTLGYVRFVRLSNLGHTPSATESHYSGFMTFTST